MKTCKKHGEVEYRPRKEGGWRCPFCASDAVIKRRRKLKEILVEEHGGSCKVCGYNRYVGALDFHHLDPSQKEFGLGMRGLTRSLTKIQAEARKCVLLCGNCHAEVEAGVISLAR
jgi:transcription elongation factor Elf1